MKKYETYKDSGIEWIGEIPSHWEKYRLAYNGDFYKGKGVSKADLSIDGLPVMLYGDIYTKYNLKTQQLVRHIPIEVAQNSFSIEKGDLLFAASGETPDEIGKCICFLGEDEAYASGDVIVYRQKQNDSVFLSYLFNSYKINEQKAKLSKGEIVVHIYSGQLRDIRFPLPPPAEQTSIATYLDRKTAEIDELIADKKRLLELYEEEKTAIINQAVTKGINPDVPMKDSGIEWLGEIPEHWEVRRIKSISSHFKGFAFKSLDFEANGIPIVKASNIKKWQIIDITSFIAENNQIPAFEKVRLNKGDAILSTVGSKPDVTNSAVGQLATVDEDFHNSYLNQNTLCIRPNEQINDVFLKYTFLSKYFRANLDSISAWIANQAYLEVEDILSIQVILPSIEEQKLIANFIESECKRIDMQINKIQKLIDLLTEYRTALISEVVTGKVKVIE